VGHSSVTRQCRCLTGPPNKERGDGVGDSSLQSHSGANLNPKRANNRDNVPKGGETDGVALTVSMQWSFSRHCTCKSDFAGMLGPTSTTSERGWARSEGIRSTEDLSRGSGLAGLGFSLLAAPSTMCGPEISRQEQEARTRGKNQVKR
jgi:hypothetical protein